MVHVWISDSPHSFSRPCAPLIIKFITRVKQKLVIGIADFDQCKVMPHIIDLNKPVEELEEVVDLEEDDIDNIEWDDVKNLERDDIVNEVSQLIDVGVTDQEPQEVVIDDDPVGEEETIEVPIDVGVTAEEAEEVVSDDGTAD
ncbi:hypothetical protein Sjap_002207 [Stephania japonica]|uniref:Uncharacterized protein n=1 Tax=Stephania japonica TaxID=461633 RepID=A0AAP0KNQ4_9MAGN